MEFASIKFFWDKKKHLSIPIMGVAEDAALFLQVDFEVFGHVQGDLKNLSVFSQSLKIR